MWWRELILTSCFCSRLITEINLLPNSTASTPIRWILKHTQTRTHARTHARTHTLTVCSRNWVLILVGMKILWGEEGFQFGFKRRRRRHTVRGICCLRPLIVSVRPMHWPCLTDELKVRQSMLDQWNWKRWVSAREPEWNSHCYSDEVGIK